MTVLLRRLFACSTLLVTSQPALGSETYRPCESAADPELKAVIQQVQSKVEKVWAKRGPDWITTYDVAAKPKNPFDIQGVSPGSPAIRGYAWLRDVGCVLSDGKIPGTLILNYRAAAFRFKEDSANWTEPLTDGLIVEFLLTPDGKNWRAEDKSKEETSFLPEGSQRLPRDEELPPIKAWPDKRCRLPKVWQGTKCESPEASAPDRETVNR